MKYLGKKTFITKQFGASTVPMMAASNAVSPNNLGPNNTIPISSNVAGTKHIKKAGLPSFLKADKSSPKPALVSIIIRAIFLKSADMAKILGSNRFKTQGPSIMPVINIPSKLGSFSFWQIYPNDIPTIRINEILNNIISLSKNTKS